jgi:predicted DNA-binding transcriptional regulator YafY
VLKGAAWYVVAKGQHRTNAFRVNRILSLSTLDEHFDRPAGFDLAEYWVQWTRNLEKALYSGETVVRVGPRAVDRWFLLGPVFERALRETAGPPDADGWVRAVLPMESIEHAVHDFGRFGADLEVLEPLELRERMRAEAAAMLRLYG